MDDDELFNAWLVIGSVMAPDVDLRPLFRKKPRPKFLREMLVDAYVKNEMGKRKKKDERKTSIKKWAKYFGTTPARYKNFLHQASSRKSPAD